ncbi:hypothetical protein KTQ96_15590, partial [Prevotella copri]|uniref:hypothetical protein n=1 Tax=Segatella copri TaxID=165179 RepID=UPI001C2C4C76
ICIFINKQVDIYSLAKLQLFDTPRASLKVQEFLTKVDFLAQSLRSGKSIKREELDDFINELCELIALVE